MGKTISFQYFIRVLGETIAKVTIFDLIKGV